MALDTKENRDNYWKKLLQYPLFDNSYFDRKYMKTSSSYKSLALYSRRPSDIFNSNTCSLNFKFDARNVGDVRSESTYLSVELTLHSKNDDKIPTYNHLEQRRMSIENQLDSLKNEFNAVFRWDSKFQTKYYPANESREEYTTCVSGIQLCKFDLDLQDETNFEEACDFHSKCMPEFKSALESELKSILGC
jgi:hypothetical protein